MREKSDLSPAVPAASVECSLLSCVQNSIAVLNIHVDQFESEVESLMIGVKKKKNDNQVGLNSLFFSPSFHSFSFRQLYSCLRFVDPAKDWTRTVARFAAWQRGDSTDFCRLAYGRINMYNVQLALLSPEA